MDCWKDAILTWGKLIKSSEENANLAYEFEKSMFGTLLVGYYGQPQILLKFCAGHSAGLLHYEKKRTSEKG